MALTPSFSVAQGSNPQEFTLTDTSTGSDGAVVDRRIYIQLADGSYLVPTGTTTDYIPFPLSDGASITISVLTVDYAVSITVQWLDVSNAVLYTLSQSYCFTGNDEEFMYGLVQYMAANPQVLQNTNFIGNCFELNMYVDYAVKAVTEGNDINGAQYLLDLAQAMINNQSMFFGNN